MGEQTRVLKVPLIKYSTLAKLPKAYQKKTTNSRKGRDIEKTLTVT